MNLAEALKEFDGHRPLVSCWDSLDLKWRFGRAEVAYTYIGRIPRDDGMDWPNGLLLVTPAYLECSRWTEITILNARPAPASPVPASPAAE